MREGSCFRSRGPCHPAAATWPTDRAAAPPLAFLRPVPALARRCFLTTSLVRPCSLRYRPPPLFSRSHKTLKTKSLLAVARRKNRQLPNWFRYKNLRHEIRYNAKRRNWRRTKLGI